MLADYLPRKFRLVHPAPVIALWPAAPPVRIRARVMACRLRRGAGAADARGTAKRISLSATAESSAQGTIARFGWKAQNKLRRWELGGPSGSPPRAWGQLPAASVCRLPSRF